MPPDNDLQQEIEQLEQRHAENPDGLVFAHLADAYRKASEYAKAEGLILHGLKKHPNYISAYNVLGRVYLDAERLADAHEQFNKVLEFDPQNMIALRALGDLALNGGRLEEARRWYERILAIDPRNKDALEGLAVLEAGPQSPAADAAAGGEPPGGAGGAGGEEFELGFGEGELEGLDLEGIELGLPDDEVDLALEPQFDQPTGEEKEEPEAVEGIGPVEGLVNKETMTRSRDEVEPDPEVESASMLTQQEFIGGAKEADGEAGPWTEESVLDLLEETDIKPEPDLVAGAGAAGDSFGESVLGGLEAGDATVDVPVEGDSVDIDLNEMEDWTPGFLHGDDLAAEKDAELGEAAVEEAGGEFSIEFGEPESEPAIEAKRPAIGEGMVTETMAELYADQGLFADALDIYRKLMQARPGDERLRARVAELEERLEEESAPPATGLELDELLDLSEPRVPSDFPVESLPAADELLELGEPQAPEPPTQPSAPPEATEVTEPAFLGQPPAEVAPIAGAGEGEFSFADEAPVAGFEQLDPFAASFDVLSKRDAPPRPAAPTPPPTASQPGFEGPVPVSVDGVPLSDPSILPPGAAIEPAPALAEPQPPAAPSPKPAAEPAAPAAYAASADGMTIEEYLSSMLAYDSSAPRAPSQPPAQPEAGPAGGGDAEDLEQFQEWLRGLKS